VIIISLLKAKQWSFIKAWRKSSKYFKTFLSSSRLLHSFPPHYCHKKATLTTLQAPAGSHPPTDPEKLCLDKLASPGQASMWHRISAYSNTELAGFPSVDSSSATESTLLPTVLLSSPLTLSRRRGGCSAFYEVSPSISCLPCPHNKSSSQEVCSLRVPRGRNSADCTASFQQQEVPQVGSRSLRKSKTQSAKSYCIAKG